MTFFGDGFSKKCLNLDFCPPKIRECKVDNGATLKH